MFLVMGEYVELTDLIGAMVVNGAASVATTRRRAMVLVLRRALIWLWNGLFLLPPLVKEGTNGIPEVIGQLVPPGSGFWLF